MVVDVAFLHFVFTNGDFHARSDKVVITREVFDIKAHLGDKDGSSDLLAYGGMKWVGSRNFIRDE